MVKLTKAKATCGVTPFANREPQLARGLAEKVVWRPVGDLHDCRAGAVCVPRLDPKGLPRWRWYLVRLAAERYAVRAQPRTRPLAEVEALLVNSLEITRRQQARSWELRTACDLARLWQHQGRGAEALQLVQTIYYQLTEGFDTGDVRDAKALLAELELSDPTRTSAALVHD